MMEPSLPLPLDPVPPPAADDKRLWIGNISNKLSEYNILKMVQTFGAVKKFDFLFHKSGPLKGQPRGYCFVTFETKEQAESALASLNGKKVLSKELAVKWANTVPADTYPPKKESAPAVQVQDLKETKSVLSQIREIESKLKVMDEQRDKELEACLAALPLPVNNPLLTSYRNRSQKSRVTPYSTMNRKKFSGHKR